MQKYSKNTQQYANIHKNINETRQKYSKIHKHINKKQK